MTEKRIDRLADETHDAGLVPVISAPLTRDEIHILLEALPARLESIRNTIHWLKGEGETETTARMEAKYEAAKVLRLKLEALLK